MSDPLLEAAESLLPGDGIEGLYLHVPFCRKRCSYCAFHSQALPQDDPLLDDYALALSNRVRRLSKAGLLGDLRTIYLGGGTPSFLGARRLSGLIYMISLRVNLHDDTEFTLELNPDSFDRALLKDLWALGVNRYSVGVQSFDDAVLKRLGRIHDA
ncbi:MAG: radical SAM protein, partial [Coriobacteriales bacterium]|nr:radical SAM protein [Coriobacteriales bacterium]